MDEPRAGQDFAGYRIERLIGRGGMGRVYLAEHLHLGRKVALKFLATDLATESTDFQERFIRESRLAASISHPNIVTVYDAGEHGGHLYIAMQYVEGTDLATLLKEHGELDPDQAVDTIEQIASALDAAHAEGLVHRDVKPANVLIKDRRSYLTDFGLTKRAAASKALTQTGQFLGTLEYMAPEQVEGRPVDGRTDVYALGCLLFHCVTGRIPFERDGTVATIWAHLSESPPRASVEAEVPPALDGVIERAMAKAPDDRFQSAGDMAGAARAALGGVEPEPLTKGRSTRASAKSSVRPPAPTDRGRSRGLLVSAGLALAAAVAVVLLLALGGGEEQDATERASAERFRVRSIPLKSISFGVAIDPANSSVWVTGPDKGLLTRIDTVVNAPVEPPLQVGEDPFALTVAGSHVWVPIYGEGTVIRLPAARRIGRPRRLRVGGKPSQIVVSAGTVWVADDTGFARRIDEDTLRLKGKPTPLGKGARTVVADLAGAWVSNILKGTVTRIDPEGQIQGKPIRVGSRPAGLAIAAGHVWVATQGDGAVTRISARSGKVVGRPIPVGRGPFGVAAGAGYIWVANSADNSVSRIDPRTARVVGRPIRVGASPLGIAVGQNAVWVATTEARAISVIELKRSKGNG